MRVIFFNEGNLGTHIMGQGQLQGALQLGLTAHAAPTASTTHPPGPEQRPELSARFAGLTPMGRVESAIASRPITSSGKTDFGLRTLRWHLVQSLRARAALRRELREWPAEIVHVHSHSVAFALGARPGGAALALSVDTTVREWWEMPAWRQAGASAAIAPSCRLERGALSRAQLVLAWTAWAQRSVQRAAPEARVVEHHPGLDLDHYRPVQRSPRERPRVLFVGGRFAEKGGEDLLAALGDDLGRTVELDLVTPAEVHERPGVRVHRLGPSDPALLQLQQQADLMCLPTHGDAAPWAVLEAMACGTPVLSTHIGGIPDLLDEGRAGVLVDHGDRRGLREGLLALLSDGQLRERLADAARARCEQRYDARRQFPRMIEHFADL